MDGFERVERALFLIRVFVIGDGYIDHNVVDISEVIIILPSTSSTQDSLVTCSSNVISTRHLALSENNQQYVLLSSTWSLSSRSTATSYGVLPLVAEQYH